MTKQRSTDTPASFGITTSDSSSGVQTTARATRSSGVKQKNVSGQKGRKQETSQPAKKEKGTPRSASRTAGKKSDSGHREIAVRSHEGRQRPMANGRRAAMIAEAAYFRAERRGFSPGGELDDWLAAEHEIDRFRNATGF